MKFNLNLFALSQIERKKGEYETQRVLVAIIIIKIRRLHPNMVLIR